MADNWYMEVLCMACNGIFLMMKVFVHPEQNDFVEVYCNLLKGRFLTRERKNIVTMACIELVIVLLHMCAMEEGGEILCVYCFRSKQDS